MKKDKNKDKVDVSKKTGKILPPKKDPSHTCNARKGSGGYCMKAAGWGTNHVGEGRCKLHGGMSTGRPKKAFSAASYLDADIIRTFEEISDEDPQSLSNIDNEINVIRGHFYKYFKNIPKTKDGKEQPVDAAVLQKFINTLTKLIETKAKIEGKINSQKIPTQLVVLYVNNVTRVLEKHIKDDDLRRRIASDMREIKLDLQESRN